MDGYLSAMNAKVGLGAAEDQLPGPRRTKQQLHTSASASLRTVAMLTSGRTVQTLRND